MTGCRIAAPLHRRALLALSAATLGAAASRPSAAASPGGADALAGILLAWLRIAPGDGGELRVVRCGAGVAPQELLPGLRWRRAEGADADVTMPGGACRLAHDRARRAAARLWTVPASECRVEADCLAHPPSGRALPYWLWLEIT
jgi:hypothetical protein